MLTACEVLGGIVAAARFTQLAGLTPLGGGKLGLQLSESIESGGELLLDGGHGRSPR
jgi:hypothetical protein